MTSKNKPLIKRFFSAHSSAKILAFWEKYEKLESQAQVLKVEDWLATQGLLACIGAAFRDKVKDTHEKKLLEFRMSCINPKEREKIEVDRLAKIFNA